MRALLVGAALAAASLTAVTTAPAHAATVTYSATGFSQRTVVLAPDEPLIIESSVQVTFVSTSPAITAETVQSGRTVTYHFSGLPAGAFTIQAVVPSVEAAPKSTLTVVRTL